MEHAQTGGKTAEGDGKHVFCDVATTAMLFEAYPWGLWNRFDVPSMLIITIVVVILLFCYTVAVATESCQPVCRATI